MKWCLRVVFDGDRPATADLFQVEDDHIFGNTGCELHTEVGASSVERLMKGVLTGLDVE